MNRGFFDLLKPLTDYIDSGNFFRKPFQWLYYTIGVLCAILPLYVLYLLLESRIFKYADGGDIFAIILIFFLFTAVCVMGFLLWFSRAKKLPELLPEGSKFVAVPGVANFIQTSGEFFGLLIGVFGFIGGILCSVFGLGLGRDIPILATSIPMSFLSLLYGYLIIIFTRYISELILSIADIANNVEKLTKK